MNSILKNIVTLALLGAVLIGCDNTKYETSAVLQEDGVVYDSVYVPDGYGSDIEYGIDADGNFTIETVSVYMPERYAVVFACQHGKFVIKNTNQAAQLYHRLKRNQKVTIFYKEITKITQDKSKTEVEDVRQFHDFDFVDAVAQNE